MDFMPLRLNSTSLTCSICALAAIILQLVAMECQKLHVVDSPVAIIRLELDELESILHNFVIMEYMKLVAHEYAIMMLQDCKIKLRNVILLHLK